MMPLSPSSGRQQQQRSTLSASGHARHADAYGTFHADGSGDDDDDFDVPARVRVARGSSGLRAHTTTLRTVAVVGFVLFAMSYVLTAQDPIIVQPRASPLPVNNNAAAAPSAPALDVTGLAAMTATERTFLAGVDTTHIREFLHAYASRPHPAGSAQDYATAVYTAKQFEAFGLNATIQEYYPLLSLPVRRSVVIVAPPAAARVLNLTEAAVPGDTCTADADALPPFLAYAASGNVTASVVYANFGRPEDFDWLVAQNVSLREKIALVRYGGNFRGLKVMAAEAHGCAGVLIYSDPHEDGFTQGAVYPDGPWRPAGSFQRGSVQYNSLAGGDPLTPGWASKLGAPYLNISTAPTIPHIPALPLSYEQATYILASLGGTQAPSTWQGALVLTTGAYRVGDDGATVVNLDLVMDNKVGPIWDVIGTIDGVDEPDARVLIGNHRDAWVCGAVDPSSGSAVMLEVARNLGTLLETGWRPRRTLVLASWDGEEYGLLGSTEYAEDHAEVLARDAVAYINVDNVVGPFVMASGTPSIAGFLLDTAKSVPANLYNANTTELTLYEQWVNQTTARRAAATTLGGVNAGNDGTLGPDHMIGFMGSGTDFTAFYQHLGIISANLGYVLGAGMYGTYHSTMDSLAYMERVGDPTYATHKTTTQWWGLLALRLADALVVPFDFTTYALVMDDDLASYALQIDAIHGDAVDLTPLQDAIKEFGANAELFQARVVDFATNTTTGDDAVTRRAWNAKLVTLERQLLSADGLPHRPWFKHVIFGPGFYEGYGGTAFPGIDDAIAFKDNATTVQTHVDDVASIVRTAAAFMVEPLVLQ